MALRLAAVCAVMLVWLCAPSTALGQDTAQPCPGQPIDDGDANAGPDQVMTGTLDDGVEGGYVFLPFGVPADTTAVRVKYCFEQTGNPADPQDRSTLDLGLYEPRESAARPWGPSEFRGWGGSSHPDVIVSPHGFTSERRYRQDPDLQVPGRTTRAFLPGPIEPGRWAVELGVAAVASSGNVPYRVEIELSDEDFPFARYAPAPYDRSSARTERRWYAGDFHVHGEHSALGDAPMSEVFDYAFGSLAAGKAGLDFITLSDYVSGSSWGEVGRHQDDYPNDLIIRSAEVITYRGHMNSHANTRVMDYRHGPLYRRTPAGFLTRLRGPRPASDTFDRVHSAGGFTQINHPTIFPSPPFPENQCRGCEWDYSDGQTDFSKVDAIEIATGPAEFGPANALGPNPFTVTGIEFWEDALEAGHRIAAVGSSDSHNAGRTPGGVTQAPIGTATTVVYASRLSVGAIRRAVNAGHTYVKVTGNDAPDLRLRASAPGRATAIMGDTLQGGAARFTARVLRGGPGASTPGPRELTVIKDGEPFRSVPVTGGDFRFGFSSDGPGRYRLQLMRGSVIEGMTSPVYLEPARGRCGGRPVTIGATGGDDVIHGTGEADVISARSGEDAVHARGGRDVVCGGSGPDRLNGDGGPDRLLGQRGGDGLFGGRGDDRLSGGPGDDLVRGGSGRDRARGGRGRDDIEE